MAFYSILFVVAAVAFTETKGESVLPNNRNCDPLLNNCQKGDWFASNVADCCYTGPFTCDAIGDGVWDETVDKAVGDRCQPCSGQHRFNCGDYGTNSRCVCDDTATYSFEFNSCRCQYWPQATTLPPHTETPTTSQAETTTAQSPTTEPHSTEPTTRQGETTTERKQTTEPPPPLSNGAFVGIVAASVVAAVFIIVTCIRS